MLHHQNSKKSQSKKSWINTLGSIVIISMLSACSDFGADHSVCDLQLLSLKIAKQSEDAITGNAQAIAELRKSQEKLKLISPRVIQKVSKQVDAEHLQRDIQEINENINLMIKSQKDMNSLYDFSLAVADTIPMIQAEYNLLTDQMIRSNASATQVVVAKNQVFIAERILRSLASITKDDPYAVSTMEDVFADIETFDAYLKAQLEGNASLGVERINDKEQREGLESIQNDTNKVLLSGSKQLQNSSNQIIKFSNAIKQNREKTMEILNILQKIE
jgi:hypothetical protein